MAKAGFHHLHHHQQTFVLLRTQNALCHLNCSSISVSEHRFLRRLLSSPPLHVRRYRRWDSNAESYYSKNFNMDDNDETEGFYESTEQWDVLDDYIDSIWIFKVFSSFGWMLPAIIASLLLANGPKAFLMAIALPIGQSTFAFAIQKYQNRDKTNSKTKTKPNFSKTKNRRSRSRNSKLEEVAEWIGSERATKKKNKNKNGYQSWVSKTDVSSTSGSDRTRSNFGGWDELDAWTEFSEEPSRNVSQESSKLRETPSEEKQNRGSKEEDYGPLLLRFLVSIFPFLSSWTKVL